MAETTARGRAAADVAGGAEAFRNMCSRRHLPTHRIQDSHYAVQPDQGNKETQQIIRQYLHKKCEGKRVKVLAEGDADDSLATWQAHD